MGEGSRDRVIPSTAHFNSCEEEDLLILTCLSFLKMLWSLRHLARWNKSDPFLTYVNKNGYSDFIWQCCNNAVHRRSIHASQNSDVSLSLERCNWRNWTYFSVLLNVSQNSTLSVVRSDTCSGSRFRPNRLTHQPSNHSRLVLKLTRKLVSNLSWLETILHTAGMIWVLSCIFPLA